MVVVGSTAQAMIKHAGVLVTERLHTPPRRRADPVAERAALQSIVGRVSRSTDDIFQDVANVALALCDAHSAGVSILADDGLTFVRASVAGAWRGLPHSQAPRSLSPYGLVLETNASQLFYRPQRYYEFLQGAQPEVIEGLLVPYRRDGVTVGAVWVASHDESRHFDGEDERRLLAIATCATAVHKVADALEEVRYGLLATEQLAQSLVHLSGAIHTVRDVSSQSGRPTARPRLSARESEVVVLVAQGYTNQAIAEELRVNVKTVSTYRSRATDKLGFRNRADFVTYALDEGWLGSV